MYMRQLMMNSMLQSIPVPAAAAKALMAVQGTAVKRYFKMFS
jgi:hypothetical protein